MAVAVGHVGQRQHVEAVVQARFAQELDVAAALVAETEVFAHQQPARIQPSHQEVFDEGVGRHFGQARVKGLDQHLLDAGGLKVVARAAVPFEREPGESIAAVAPTAEQPADIAKPDEAAAGAGEASPPVGSQAEAPPEQPAVAQPDQPAVASTEPAPTDASPPADAAETPAPAETPPTVATAETSEPPAPVDQADAPAGEAQMEPSETPPTVAKVETEEPPAAAEQPAAAAEASQQPPASGTEVAAAPPETVSPKLEKVEGAVIIRRKDTLWQISRRVYGRGIRYWTIYLANQNQITDPDRIWPGQVFRVPEKSKEGETADMSAMGSQVTTVPKAE